MKGFWEPPQNKAFDQQQGSRTLFPALFYGGKPGTAEHEVEGWVEIPVIFTNQNSSWTGNYSVGVVSLHANAGTNSQGERVQRLVLVSGKLLLFARHLGNEDEMMRNNYSLSLVRSRFEPNPLVLLFQDQGGNSRSFTYELYRIEPDGLRRLWAWSEDGYTISTSQWYSLSNFDFSSLESGTKNQFTIYTTHGHNRAFDNITEKDLIPHHRKTIFRWSERDQQFLAPATN